MWPMRTQVTSALEVVFTTVRVEVSRESSLVCKIPAKAEPPNRDVSANGAYMLSYSQAHLYHEFGTSLAAPIWASVVTLVSTAQSILKASPEKFSLCRSISSARQLAKAPLASSTRLFMPIRGRLTILRTARIRAVGVEAFTRLKAGIQSLVWVHLTFRSCWSFS